MNKPRVRIVQNWEPQYSSYIYRVEVRRTFLRVFKYWSKYKETTDHYNAVKYAQCLYKELVKDHKEVMWSAQKVIWEAGDD